MAAPLENLAINASRNFAQWLAGIDASIAFSTYQASQLVVLGVGTNGNLTAAVTPFERCMGIGVLPGRPSFFLGTQYQIVRFDGLATSNRGPQDWHVIYGPHQTWVTGDVDIHDIAVARGDTPV